MKYARIVSDYAIDVRTESPEGCFTPNIVAEFIEVPDDVMDGWVVADGVWSTPPVHVPVPYVPTAEDIAWRESVIAEEQARLAQVVKPTKEDLLAQLAALSAQIQALE
jgi:hypothetical protein